MVKPKILCNPVRHLCLHGQMTPPTSHTGISAPNWLESLPPIVYFFKSKLNKEKFITDNTHTKRQHVLSWVSLAHFYGSSCTPSFFCASLLPATAPLVSTIYNFGLHLIYRKVASSSLSWLVAHLRIFIMFMKGKFDAYVLWLLAKVTVHKHQISPS